jgi:putative endonuclease
MPSRFIFPATYIMASRPLGVIYVGSTNDLPRRVWEHREGLIEGFTKANGCGMLVWYEPHELMVGAVQRELAIKHWRRVWKLELIEHQNPEWRDLYPDLA